MDLPEGLKLRETNPKSTDWRKDMYDKWSKEIEEEIFRIYQRDGGEHGLFIGDMLAIGEYELEDEVWEYLKDYPDATAEELGKFITSLCPPLEIVDDDEWDEDEDNE